MNPAQKPSLQHLRPRAWAFSPTCTAVLEHLSEDPSQPYGHIFSSTAVFSRDTPSPFPLIPLLSQFPNFRWCLFGTISPLRHLNKVLRTRCACRVKLTYRHSKVEVTRRKTRVQQIPAVHTRESQKLLPACLPACPPSLSAFCFDIINPTGELGTKTAAFPNIPRLSRRETSRRIDFRCTRVNARGILLFNGIRKEIGRPLTS